MLKLLVKEKARELGLNRNQLQLMSGVTLPLLYRYWDNQTTEVKLDALERIAKALGVRAGDLIASEEEILRNGGMERLRKLNEKDAA